MKKIKKVDFEKAVFDDEVFIDRELSWLQFNARVLQEAADKNTPLVEKIRFLGIFSNNQDEFFRVRVASIQRKARIKIKGSESEAEAANQLLKKVFEVVRKQQKQFMAIFRKIVIELNSQGIFILDENSISDPIHIEFIKNFYVTSLRSHIFPVMLNTYDESAVLKDENTYLAVLCKNSNTQAEDYALIEVPTFDLPRIILLPNLNDNNTYLIIIDDVIRYFLNNIFSMLDYDVFSAYTVKITRDAELDIDNDESKSFIDRIEESLKQRNTGNPVRFIYDRSIPEKLLNVIQQKLKIFKQDAVVYGGKYHNFKDFMDFPLVGDVKNIYSPQPPLPHPDLNNAKRILDVLDEKDVMLMFPYQSFHYIIDFLREASINPDVRSIKMTVYRLAPNSKVMNALINAARNGKSVTVFMELQARFDEKLNIYWSAKLKQAGVRILHSIPGLKVHSKLIQVRKIVDDTDTFYTLVGTGNFNEITSKIFSDCILMTSDSSIGQDVRNVFSIFDTVYRPQTFKSLFVSPFTTRKFIKKQIRRLIYAAQSGQESRCIIKLNNLVDKEIISMLYLASQSGVKIDLIIRGICVLVPGVPGVSENITAISIVDRYLEHSRVLYFNIDSKEEFYISSADWMQRNLDTRIEVVCPIFDPKIQKDLLYLLNLQLNDNHKARLHDAKFPNLHKKNDLPKVQTQTDFYKYCLKKIADE